MTELFDYISTWSVLKWVILVLIAGFIGQFGRMMAEAVIAKARRQRELAQKPEDDKPEIMQTTLPSATEWSAPTAASGEMSDKKRVKALTKARKKEAKNK